MKIVEINCVECLKTYFNAYEKKFDSVFEYNMHAYNAIMMI